jgi:hypothetical protein
MVDLLMELFQLYDDTNLDDNEELKNSIKLNLSVFPYSPKVLTEAISILTLPLKFIRLIQDNQALASEKKHIFFIFQFKKRSIFMLFQATCIDLFFYFYIEEKKNSVYFRPFIDND